MGLHTLMCKNTCAVALLEEDVVSEGLTDAWKPSGASSYNSFCDQLKRLGFIRLPL